MDIFDDIAAIAAGAEKKIAIQDAVKAYEKDGVTRVLKLWQKFAAHLPPATAQAEIENPFQSPPQLNWIKAYLSWRVRVAQSRLDDRMALSTLVKELQQVLRIVKVATGHTYDSIAKIELKSHIEALVKSKSVSTKARAKAVALYIDSEEIITFLWCCDEYTYTHPRIMIQLTFYILVSSYWGLRPGEIVESSVHRGSNEGFQYQDISLSLVRHKETRSLIYQMVITLRNRKFKRDLESEDDRVTLKEETDPEKRFTCPVRWFLSMALEDKVFVGHKDPADFEDRWIREGANSREISIAQDKKKLPILRKLVGNKISADQIMSAQSILGYLKQLCERCGYNEAVTCYAFRRGFANGIEGKVSGGRFKKAIAHKNDQIFQSYVSSVIGIDTQNVVRNLPEDTVHMDLTRSIAFTRDLNNPKPHGSTFDKCDPRPTSDIIEQVAARFPKNKKNDIMRKARRVQFLEAKKAYHDDDTPVPVEERVTGQITDTRVKPKPTPLFRQMLKYNTLQASVIDNLWSAEPTSIGTSVQLLLPLANPEEFRVWYPQPVSPPSADMTCSDCGIALAKLKKRVAALHLLECYCFSHGVLFCFHCAQFVDKEPGTCRGKGQNAATHECSGVDREDSSCGVVYWRDLLIRPGRCLFCNDNKSWTDVPKLKLHIESHLEGLQEGSICCPHPLCRKQHNTRDDLKLHLVSAHGIEMHSKSSRGSKRSFQELSR